VTCTRLSSTSLREKYDPLTGLVFVLVGVLIAFLLPLWKTGPFLTIAPKAGVSAFAVAYLDAQLIERLIEPINKHFGNNNEIDKLRKQQNSKEKNKQNSKELTDYETQRAFSIWGFASLLGIVLCYFTVGLYATVGGTFTAPLLPYGYALDSIFSGIIVGGGTKPLHDVIEYLNAPAGKGKS